MGRGDRAFLPIGYKCLARFDRISALRWWFARGWSSRHLGGGGSVFLAVYSIPVVNPDRLASGAGMILFAAVKAN